MNIGGRGRGTVVRNKSCRYKIRPLALDNKPSDFPFFLPFPRDLLRSFSVYWAIRGLPGCVLVARHYNTFRGRATRNTEFKEFVLRHKAALRYAGQLRPRASLGVAHYEVLYIIEREYFPPQ